MPSDLDSLELTGLYEIVGCVFSHAQDVLDFINGINTLFILRSCDGELAVHFCNSFFKHNSHLSVRPAFVYDEVVIAVIPALVTAVFFTFEWVDSADNEILNVVFHSLRHSSTTYKLKLNHGDLKATQGDTGHAEIDMITKVYAHILDEDRKINAQKFESAFYSNPDLRKSAPPQEPVQSQPLDLAALIEQLQKSPELASTLASLIAGQGA